MEKFMQLEITSTLVISSAAMEMFPVRMQGPMPSLSGDEVWKAFVVPGGKSVSISMEDAERCRFYMGRHHTEAVSEDGVTAYTLQGRRLLECNPAYNAVAA